MTNRKKPAATEVDAYIFIKSKLTELGWNARNPERNECGQVWTQNECLSNPHIKNALGLERPENIVKITDEQLWVVEAKRSHGEVDTALSEAQYYAQKLNGGSVYRANIASGVAGNNDDGFITRTVFLKDEKWHTVTINSADATALLSPDECKTLLDNRSPCIKDPRIDDRRFVSTAEKINEILHAGAINPHDRAKVVSALLLAMLNQNRLDIEQKEASVLVGDINNRVQNILQRQNKTEFIEHIRIPVPSATDNQAKFRKALVESLQELRGLNIASAMQSGADWLGTFYEVFLKYARWAQDLGIVLTPRHITRFAAQAMSIKATDIVFDPTCGTGGFLVSAFEEVKRSSSQRSIDTFKRNHVFGLEQDAGIAALAVVNMIFRGDGKNNIAQASCFGRFLDSDRNGEGYTAKFTTKQSSHPPVTKVLMNPPFSVRGGEKEYKFIDHALDQMDDYGLLFSVLPYSVMVKSNQFKTWRKILLEKNTLLAVVTFPIDIFYPISVPPIGIFVKKGVPHMKSQNVLWVRAETDGYIKSKGKRLPDPNTTNDLEACLPSLQAFLNNPETEIKSKPKFVISMPVNFEDSLFELVPEAYLEEDDLSDVDVVKNVDAVLRESSAFLIRNAVPATWDDGA